jgi:hypothetical protein
MGNPGEKKKQTHNMKRQVSKGKPWKRGKKNIVVDAVQFFYHLQLLFFSTKVPTRSKDRIVLNP